MNRINSKALKIHFLYCSNSFDSSEVESLGHAYDADEFRFMSLPCSGKFDLLYLIKAFETGADGIILLTCPKNECRHLEGNLRAPKRAEKVNSLLSEIGMENDRVLIISKDGEGMDEISSLVSSFIGRIRNTVSFPASRVS